MKIHKQVSIRSDDHLKQQHCHDDANIPNGLDQRLGYEYEHHGIEKSSDYKEDVKQQAHSVFLQRAKQAPKRSALVLSPKNDFRESK